MIPSIAIFGLNEFSVRFPTALISTLSIPLFYFLFKKLTRKENVAVLGTTLVTISPWHIYFSRYVSDHLMAGVFVALGLYLFLKMLDGEWWWSILSAFAFVLSVYTYYPERLFVPLFLLALTLLERKVINLKRRKVLGFCFLLVLSLHLHFYTELFSEKTLREPAWCL